MSDILEEIGFEGSGLNRDDDKRFFRIKGDSEYRLNILVGEDGNNGVITNMKGNHVISYPLYQSNTYLVLGSCYDNLTRAVYYWVFSQPYDYSISDDYVYDNRLLRFNEDTETIDTIFIDTANYFGLHPDYLMKDPFVIGDWLYFNPRVSEPKMLSITQAYNYTNYLAYNSSSTYVYGDKRTYYGGLFMALAAVSAGQTPTTHISKWERIDDSYQDYPEFTLNFDSEFHFAFNVIRQSPVNRPICVYDFDANKTSNNIKNIVFRFAYRNKYFDDSYSTFSALSDVTLPNIAEYYNGEIIWNTTANNFIKVNIPLPSAGLVKEVELVFQEIGGNWKRAEIINRRDVLLINSTNYVYNFYNDESYTPIANDLVTKISDAVPRTAECQEIINKNILTYAYCKEGFDNLDKNDIQVTLTPEIENFIQPPEVGTLRRDNINQGDILLSGSGSSWTSALHCGSWFAGSGIAAGDIYRVKINNGETYYTIQAADIISINAFVIAIRNFLIANFPQFNIVSNLITHEILIYNSSMLSQIPVFAISKFYLSSALVNTTLYKKRGFKTGAWHPFCLFYYDGAMRRWDAQVSKDNVDGANAFEVEGTTTYVPMFNETAPLPTNTANRWIINWAINHLPPDGAKYWRWGYAGNSLCSYFVQYIADSFSNVTGDPPNSTRIDITPLQELTIDTSTSALDNQFPQSIISPYEWQKGDRVRMIVKKGTGTTMGALVGGMLDFEIIKFDSDNNYIYTQQFNYVVAGMGDKSLIEIYRPLQTDTETKYYEFGELYPIIEDSGGIFVHAGDTQDQDKTVSQEATGIFEAGDVYHILRTPSRALNAGSTTDGYFHESKWYSDFYDSDEWDKGKQGEETTFNERNLNIVRYSNQYLQNTQINGIPTFDGLHYKELNDIYGKVLRIIEIGDTLKVYQRKKPSSILIGRTEYTDAEGQGSVVISDRIFGAIRYSSTNYGTEFPESISRNNRYVYGFDVYNGVFWRDSANGIFPISGRYEATDGTGDYKMDSYFKQKAKALLVSGIDHVDVMTVWDERYKNLYVTFRDFVNEANNETIVFHEPSNRWICFTEFDQTSLGGWNQMVELTYSIVKGFEGGIGFNFDEETRFAEFIIATPGNLKQSMTVAELVYDAPDPIASTSQTIIDLTSDMVYDAPDPIATVGNPPIIVLDSIELTPPIKENTSIPVTLVYDNTGGAGIEDVDWRITGPTDYNVVVDSGTNFDVHFDAFTTDGEISITGVVAPIHSPSYYRIYIKLSSQAWASAIYSVFISTT